MKFRVGREALGEAVAWVARALPARPVVPVLSGMLLEADGPADGEAAGGAGSAGTGVLTLSCFDYNVSARLRIDVDVGEPGRALVPGRLLAEITRSLPGGAAEFTSDADTIGLTCGNAEFTLVSLPIEDYPALPEPPLPVGTIDGGALAVAATQVAPAASRDDTLPVLTAVCMDINGETLTLAATDRYRMAVRDLRWAPAQPDLRAVALVPARTLVDVARTMARGTPVTVAFGLGEPDGRGQRPGGQRPGDQRPAEGMISFEGGGRRLTARLIGGEFIRYQSRFPAEFGCRAELPAAAFLDAIRRVSLVAERASPVSLTFGGGTVTLEARTEGRARAVETVPADFEGSERFISFNPHYLLDGAVAATAVADPARHQAAAGDGASQAEVSSADPGRIRLEFTSPAKPAMITWAGPDAGAAEGAEAAGRVAAEPGAADSAGAVASAGVATDAGRESSGSRDATEPAEDDVVEAPFRYLLVPLRSQPRA